jgi:hypothetical protein
LSSLKNKTGMEKVCSYIVKIIVGTPS